MRQGNDGQTEWVVRNELGQRIERLLLRTEEGWYQVGELAAGGEARAINTDPLSFANEIAPWLRRAAAPGDRADSNLGIWNRSTNDWSHPFEQWGLIDYLLPKNDLPGSLKPGEYLALLEDDSQAGSLAEKVRYQQQVHVIHGQW